ncbi:conserved hypothetical protein [Theileria orientalis strain Shintoku]|uniref:Uncharacterized protein n=1 Tax=Theileria orientalis strain Shintoku TaxID=869250 RepID=J4DPM9_THEOR|nr:conserved hypothetical protein [Theileria orientalis strain Shintoku]PVC52203.1 hypothetical protein MACL_00000959 [Theileria orientalis]BAM40984.1 conserved hypothetical protein [Theileria orientalis strain Shintoku]|eukprot:XP_009691285.1 conserved hypothetical protein [Theileria orientalis strain Shintoku]
MKGLFIFLFLFKFCLGDNDVITLDLSKEGDHSKFIKNKHNYRGVEYYTFMPIPGYTIGRIKFHNYIIYDRKEGDDRVEGTYLYYNRYNHDIPIFVIKTGILRRSIFPVSGRSQNDEENSLLVRTLMRFIQVLTPITDPLHTMLGNLDDRPDPVETTINSITYRVYNGQQYVGGCDGKRVFWLPNAARINIEPKEEVQMETEEAEASGYTSAEEGSTSMDTS